MSSRSASTVNVSCGPSFTRRSKEKTRNPGTWRNPLSVNCGFCAAGIFRSFDGTAPCLRCGRIRFIATLASPDDAVLRWNHHRLFHLIPFGAEFFEHFADVHVWILLRCHATIRPTGGSTDAFRRPVLIVLHPFMACNGSETKLFYTFIAQPIVPSPGAKQNGAPWQHHQRLDFRKDAARVATRSFSKFGIFSTVENNTVAVGRSTSAPQVRFFVVGMRFEFPSTAGSRWRFPGLRCWTERVR